MRTRVAGRFPASVGLGRLPVLLLIPVGHSFRPQHRAWQNARLRHPVIEGRLLRNDPAVVLRANVAPAPNTRLSSFIFGKLTRTVNIRPSVVL